MTNCPRMRRATEMVPRDAPDHLPRLAMLFCGRRDMDEQFNLGTELMICSLDGQNGEPVIRACVVNQGLFPR